MPRLVDYYVAVSLDGYIAEPDGSFARFPQDETFLPAFFERLQQHYDAVIMGRKTYEVGVREGVTNPYPWLDTYVFSASPPSARDDSITWVDAEATAFVRALKDTEGGNIWLCGGAHFAGSLLRAGLVDRITVKQNPVLFGAGVPLFAGEAFQELTLQASTAYPGGTVVTSYAVNA